MWDIFGLNFPYKDMLHQEFYCFKKHNINAHFFSGRRKLLFDIRIFVSGRNSNQKLT
jgi:hypothetical protein